MKITNIQITNLETNGKWDNNGFVGFSGLHIDATGKTSLGQVSLELMPTQEEVDAIVAIIKQIEHRFNSEE